jgi:hypothetical protein
MTSSAVGGPDAGDGGEGGGCGERRETRRLGRVGESRGREEEGGDEGCEAGHDGQTIAESARL